MRVLARSVSCARLVVGTALGMSVLGAFSGCGTGSPGPIEDVPGEGGVGGGSEVPVHVPAGVRVSESTQASHLIPGLVLSHTKFWRTGSGELRWMAVVRNDSDAPICNVTLLAELLSSAGDVLATLPAQSLATLFGRDQPDQRPIPVDCTDPAGFSVSWYAFSAAFDPSDVAEIHYELTGGPGPNLKNQQDEWIHILDLEITDPGTPPRRVRGTLKNGPHALRFFELRVALLSAEGHPIDVAQTPFYGDELAPDESRDFETEPFEEEPFEVMAASAFVSPRIGFP
jgi:hypothetical protein